VRITVIATGFLAREERRAPARVPAQVPATAAVKTVPPPLPAEAARPKEPIRLAQPVAQPATVSVPRAVRREGFKPAESDDQYDIPAFLRRNGQRE